MYAALILSGGGARGAYQYGMLQRFHEAGAFHQLQWLAGTSIGAINAALLIMDLQRGKGLDTLRSFWLDADLSHLFSVIDAPRKAMTASDYWAILQDALRHRRLRITPFKERVRELVCEPTIRSSGFQFAIKVYNLDRRRGETWFLEDIPEGQLAEYLLASASFPVFGPHHILGQRYLDGGIAANLPLDILDRASGPALAVDVASFMRYQLQQIRLERKYRDRLTLIRPSRSIPSPAHLSEEGFNNMIRQGEQDGHRALVTPIG